MEKLDILPNGQWSLTKAKHDPIVRKVSPPDKSGKHEYEVFHGDKMIGGGSHDDHSALTGFEDAYSVNHNAITQKMKAQDIKAKQSLTKAKDPEESTSIPAKTVHMESKHGKVENIHPHEHARQQLESKLKAHDPNASVDHIDPKTQKTTDKPTGHLYYSVDAKLDNKSKHIDKMISHVNGHLDTSKGQEGSEYTHNDSAHGPDIKAHNMQGIHPIK